MKTKLLCTCFACAIASLAFARQLSVEEALSNVPGRFVAGETRSGQAPSFTERVGDLNVAYVFSSRNDEGYVIVGADDLLPSVLGYSDKGTFESESIPAAMKFWLSEYGRQLAYAEANGLQESVARKVTAHPSIAPLCDASWSQSRPFNNNCPTINGAKAPSGCTATAMAQVMYAHKWPVSGTGSNSYLSGTSRERLTFDFEATVFDWANMIPSYTKSYTEQQGAAVATLMEACGNAALMSYGATVSGAYPYDAIYGMVKFMKYDKSALLMERDYYTSETWDNLVYSELSAGRPVIYGGYDSKYKNGHTFVVDGYSNDGYYHLNWGWGGLSNGYFLLTALDPNEQGIGGSGSGYNYRQDAIINVLPAKENSDYVLEVVWDGSFTTANAAYTPGGNVDFKVGNDGTFHGYTLEDTQATMGVKLVPKAGGEAVFYPASAFDFPSHYGEYETKAYKQFTIPVANFPKEGEYIVTPAYEYKGTVQDVAVRVGVSKSFVMTCSSRGVKFEAADASRTLSADNIKIENKLYSGKTCTIKAEIHNSGEEYLGLIKAGFENAEGEVRTWLDPVPVNLADGESVSVIFTGILNSYNTTLAPGTYTFNIFNEEGVSICAKPVEVNVQEVPEGRPVIDVSLEIPGCTEGDGTNFSPYLIGNEIDLEVKVSVTSGVFDDMVALYAYYDNNSSVEFSENSVSSKSFFVAPGESQKYTYHLGTSDFDVNRLVYIRAYGWKNDSNVESLGWLGRQVYVKRTSTGISSIEAKKPRLTPNPAIDFTTVESSSAIRNVEVYSVSGIKMLEVSGNGEESQNINVSSLPSGHYIVMVNADGGVERYRLIKR